jgi:phosphate transport system protein
MTESGRLHLQEEMREVEARSLGGMDFVTEAVDRTVRAILDRDPGMAHMVIADDDRIDGRFLESHQAILSLIARQAPVATDLRILAALLDVIRHIERMGDQCVNVCKVLLLAPDAPQDDLGMTERLITMGKAAKSLVADAKKGFSARDAKLAERLVDSDDVIDNLNRETFRIAVRLAEGGEATEWAMRMVQVARCFERIGDLAVDIGEETAFIATGLYREFTDASHPVPDATT